MLWQYSDSSFMFVQALAFGSARRTFRVLSTSSSMIKLDSSCSVAAHPTLVKCPLGVDARLIKECNYQTDSVQGFSKDLPVLQERKAALPNRLLTE